MFNFFKKKTSKRLNDHVALLQRVCALLPKQYNYLLRQLNEGIVNNVRKLDKPFLNYNRFSLDVGLLNKYEDKAGRCFFVKGISVYDLNQQSFVELRLVVGYGILLGYTSPSISYLVADLDKVDVRLFYIEFFGENEFNKIKPIFSVAELKMVNPADIYEIELNGQTYFHIKDLEDGDFIGIDNQKNVFRITHDPFEVMRLDKSLSEVL